MESGYSAFTISSRHRLRTHLNSLWLDRITCSAESPVPTLTEFLKLGSTGGLVTPWGILEVEAVPLKEDGGRDPPTGLSPSRDVTRSSTSCFRPPSGVWQAKTMV
jgi:hypothetical protein